MKKANEAQALGKLREYQVAQDIYRNENEGEYAGRLLDLFQAKDGPPGRPGLVSRPLAAASDQAAAPIPLSGYFFADIPQQRDGRPVDRFSQFALLAYPAQPGQTGDVAILILHDDRTAPPIDENRPVTQGGHQIWARPFRTGDRPPMRWPDQDDLTNNYVRLDRSIADSQKAIDELFTKPR